MPADTAFRKNQHPVDGHLESAAGRFPEIHLRLGKCLLELGGQTGRPRLVASNDAVFDADVHESMITRRDRVGGT